MSNRVGYHHPLVELTLLRLRTFWRETGAVFWTFGFPLALTLVLGVAFRDRPPDAVSIAVQSEALRAALSPSKDVRVEVLAEPAAREALRTGRISLFIQPGPPRTYLFDPTRPDSRLARALAENILDHAHAEAAEMRVTEPGARYVDFLVPGLIGSNIMSSGMWGVGYVIVELRNKRLIKRLVATPMKKTHFLASFVLMRLFFLVVELTILLSFGYFVFGVPIRGSLPLIAGLTLLGSLCFGGMGLLVASRAQNMPTINGLINLIIMPMFLGSGVFFSTSKFPPVVQPFLRVLPLTALNDALRAVMLQGAGISAVLPKAALLSGIAVVTFSIAVKVFRWR